MSKYKRKLLLTALVLLFSFIFTASYVSYLNSKKIIMNSMIISAQSEVSILVSCLEDIYKETQDKLDLLSNEKSLGTCVEQITLAEGQFDKSTMIQKLYFNLMSKLSNQIELTSLYVITDDFIAGDPTDNNASFFAAISNHYDWNQMNQNSVAFNILKDNFTNSQFSQIVTENQIVVSQIRKGQYLVGVLDYGKTLQFKNKNLFILNRQGEIVYTTNKDFGLTAEMLNSFNKNSYENYQVKSIGTKNYILTYKQANELNLECVLVTDTDEIYGKLQTPVQTIILASVILFSVFSLIILILTNKLIKPFKLFNDIIINVNDFSDTASINDFIQTNEKRQSLRKWVFRFYCLTFIPLLIIIMISYLSFSKVIENETIKSYYEIVKQMGQSIEYISLNHVLYANYLTFDQEIQNQLINQIPIQQSEEKPLKEDDTTNVNKTKITLTNTFLLSQSLNKKIRYIKLYDTDFNMIYSSNPNKMEYSFSDASKEYLAKPSNYYYWSINDSDSNSISLFKKVIYLPQSSLNVKYNKHLGYIELVTDKFLAPKLNIPSSGLNSFNYIIDQDRNVMDASTEGYYSLPYIQDYLKTYDIGKDQNHIVYLKGGRTLLSTYRIQDTNWSIISFIPFSSIIKENTIILYYNVTIFVILLLLVIYFSNLFAREMLKPLDQLQFFMKNVELGSVPSLSFQSTGNEFASLAENFKNMLTRLHSLGEKIRETEMEKVELEKRKKESQLVALQTQINPHFLYNIFASINVLIKMKMIDDAGKMLNATTQLLRIGIYHGNNIVKVSEEIQHVKIYMEIQQIRFKDKISFTWDINDDIMDMKMPKLILQPLVENSIEHGLEKKKKVSINIKFNVIDTIKLIIEVKDDGNGIEASELIQIRERLASHTQSEHIGLENVNERVQLYYGREFGLIVDSKLGKGTVIQVILPIIE